MKQLSRYLALWAGFFLVGIAAGKVVGILNDLVLQLDPHTVSRLLAIGGALAWVILGASGVLIIVHLMTTPRD